MEQAKQTEQPVIQLTLHEAQAIINTLGEVPGKFGAGTMVFLNNKIQEVMAKKQPAIVKELKSKKEKQNG